MEAKIVRVKKVTGHGLGTISAVCEIIDPPPDEGYQVVAVPDPGCPGRWVFTPPNYVSSPSEAVTE